MKSRINSFKYAFCGLKTFFSEEVHARVHLALAITACILAFLLHVSFYEWIVIIICICTVFGAEIFNTAIERLCDKVEKKDDVLIKKTKDLASAAVLVFSIMSAIIGAVIFIPKVYVILSKPLF